MLIARKREEELKFEKKVEMQLADKPVKSTGKSVKLPKLVITKYDGTFEKWLSFWNTFKAEVDSQDIPAVTKLAFLKKFLELKVRETINGLPFSTEGYERAKNILQSNHGNINEIMHTYCGERKELPCHRRDSGRENTQVLTYSHVQRAVFGNPGQVIWLVVYGERCLTQTARHQGRVG